MLSEDRRLKTESGGGGGEIVCRIERIFIVIRIEGLNLFALVGQVLTVAQCPNAKVKRSRDPIPAHTEISCAP